MKTKTNNGTHTGLSVYGLSGDDVHLMFRAGSPGFLGIKENLAIYYLDLSFNGDAERLEITADMSDGLFYIELDRIRINITEDSFDWLKNHALTKRFCFIDLKLSPYSKLKSNVNDHKSISNMVNDVGLGAGRVGMFIYRKDDPFKSSFAELSKEMRLEPKILTQHLDLLLNKGWILEPDKKDFPGFLFNRERLLSKPNLKAVKCTKIRSE